MIFTKKFGQNVQSLVFFMAKESCPKGTVSPWESFGIVCSVMCVFIPSPVRVGTLLMEVPGTPLGASFLKLDWNLLGRIVRTQPNMNFSTTYFRPRGIHLYIQV